MEGFYYFDGQTSRHPRESVCELHFKSTFLPDDMLMVFHGRVPGVVVPTAAKSVRAICGLYPPSADLSF